MAYRELPPPPALAPWVACAWELSVTEPFLNRVPPDGCVDLVWAPPTGVQVVGANTAAFVVPMPPGGRAVGIRFRPGAGPAFLGESGEALRDVQAPARGASRATPTRPTSPASAARWAARPPPPSSPDRILQDAGRRNRQPSHA